MSALGHDIATSQVYCSICLQLRMLNTCLNNIRYFKLGLLLARFGRLLENLAKPRLKRSLAQMFLMITSHSIGLVFRRLTLSTWSIRIGTCLATHLTDVPATRCRGSP